MHFTYNAFSRWVHFFAPHLCGALRFVFDRFAGSSQLLSGGAQKGNQKFRWKFGAQIERILRIRSCIGIAEQKTCVRPPDSILRYAKSIVAHVIHTVRTNDDDNSLMAANPCAGEFRLMRASISSARTSEALIRAALPIRLVW